MVVQAAHHCCLIRIAQLMDSVVLRETCTWQVVQQCRYGKIILNVVHLHSEAKPSWLKNAHLLYRHSHEDLIVQMKFPFV